MMTKRDLILLGSCFCENYISYYIANWIIDAEYENVYEEIGDNIKAYADRSELRSQRSKIIGRKSFITTK